MMKLYLCLEYFDIHIYFNIHTYYIICGWTGPDDEIIFVFRVF